MKLAALPIGAAVLLSIGAANAHAQYMEWTNVCLTGSLQACASASLKLQYDAALDRTTIRITLSNPQGFDPGVKHPDVQYGIRGAIFYNVADLRATPREVSGRAGTIGEGNTTGQDAFDYWIQAGRDTLDDGSGRVLSNIVGSTPIGVAYIWGCDGQAPEEWNIYSFRTCGGNFVMSFSINGQFEFADRTTVGIFGGAETGETFSCRLGENCAVVTPEPGVLILLATGLVFVLGAALRARLA